VVSIAPDSRLLSVQACSLGAAPVIARPLWQVSDQPGGYGAASAS
jgi:hypothetical protein